MEEISFAIAGMSCGGCVNSVRNALARVPGVKVQEVEVGSARLMYDPDITNADSIRAAIARAGFEPEGAT